MRYPGSGETVLINDGRVLFGLTPFREESFPGFTARLGAWNCFNSRNHFLKSLGFQDLTDGGFQDALNDRGHLAWRLRVGESELGRLVAREDHEGERYRQQLSLQTRRLSPLGLQTAQYHRSSWTNPLLPYCPESWDILIDQCPSQDCGRRLGWARVIEVDTCEHCGFDLKTAPTTTVPLKDREAFKALADLVGRDADRRIAHRDKFPPTVSNASPFDAFSLALALARASANAKTKSNYHQLSAAQKIPHLATGIQMLLDYPASFDDLYATSKITMPPIFKEAKKSISRESEVGQIYRRLFYDWMPCPHGPSRIRWQREENGQLTLREAAQKLRLENSDLRKLLDEGLIAAPQSRGAIRQHQWLDPVEVEAIRRRLDDRMSVSEFCRQYQISAAGLAQMVELGQVQLSDDPVIAELHADAQIRRSSAETFAQRLASILIVPSPDISLIPLEDLFHGIGGQAKPWGAIIQAALRRRIQLYLDVDLSEQIELRKLRVSTALAKDILASRRPDLRTVPPLSSYRVFRGHFTRTETEDYLNCFPRDLSWLISNGHLDRRMFEPHVETLGQSIISSREISWRWRVSPTLRERLGKDHGIGRVLGPFWSRAAVESYFNDMFPEGRPV